MSFFLPRDLESLDVQPTEMHSVLQITDGMSSSDGQAPTRAYQSGVQQVVEVLRKKALMDPGKNYNAYVHVWCPKNSAWVLVQKPCCVHTLGSLSNNDGDSYENIT